MHTVLAIFLRDLKRLVSNPVAMVVTIGVCVLPSLYAWFNIIANWDPYKNTSDVAIAIVDEDEGATVGDMGYINAGDMVVDELKQNTQLGWKFVDEDEATDGVQAGRYYASIVIPSDFTSSLAGVLDGKVDKVHVKYYANEKSNAVAPKVTDTGASTIETQINETFVQTVGKVVGEKIVGAAGTAQNTIVQGSESVAADVRDVEGLIDGLSQDLDDAGATIDSSSQAISSATAMLAGVDDSSAAAASQLRSAMGTLTDTRAQARTLNEALGNSLTNGAGTISSLSTQANKDLGDATSAITIAQGKVDYALSTLRDANATAQSQLERLKNIRQTIDDLPLPGGIDTAIRDHVLEKLDAQISALQTLADDQLSRINDLQDLSDSIKNDAQIAGNLSDAVNTTIQDSAQGLQTLDGDLSTTTMPKLSSALDSFSDVGNQLASTLDSVSPLLSQTSAQLAQLQTTLDQTKGILDQTKDSLGTARSDLNALAGDIDAIASADIVGQLSDLMSIDPESLGDYLGSPVDLVDESIYPVANYGSGVTPFYTNLALWVGGFVLVAIYKLEVDPEGIGAIKPWQGYFGRWLLLNTLGIFQALICCIGDLVLGIQCLSPVAFVVAGVIESFVYINIIYSLSIAFKHIGKALGVLLVVVQIPGSSGTYPIQMMPGFFQALNPWLPFTYGINAMREAIAGFYDGYYPFNIFMLLLYVVPSLFVGVVMRRHLLNINALFDRKLGETDLMVTERDGMAEVHFKLSTIIKALGNSEEFRKSFGERVANFELRYPVYIRRGFLALFWVPLVLMVLMFILPFRMITITAWIISLIATCTYLIVVEYLHSRVSEKTRIANMSSEELYQLLDDNLKQELFTFSPIESLKLDHNVGTRGLDERRGVGGDDGLELTTILDRSRTRILSRVKAKRPTRLSSLHERALKRRAERAQAEAKPQAQAGKAQTPHARPITAEQTITIHMPVSPDRDGKGDDGRA